MNIWICKNNNDSYTINSYEHYDKLNNNDIVYIYKDDYENGSFLLQYEIEFLNNSLVKSSDFEPKQVDLPYTVLYKTKNSTYLHKLNKQERDYILGDLENNIEDLENHKQFISFLKYIKPITQPINLNNIDSNIIFSIGQPNTGKSYNFEKSQIFSESDIDKNQYLKIPVSGGIGNEYKGLQSTDLAITYDPIKKELKFGEFLQILMSAIVNPSIPHIIFLDDFHNQDISSLLSEYTPLFKAQQKRDIIQPDESDNIYNKSFSDIDEFIDIWNNFIITHCTNTPIVPLTNRISGKSLNLVYPSNFYLLGAANFNENSLNIFADWEDRAKITYKNPIKDFNYVLNEDDKYNENDIHFLECCKAMNSNLKEILELNNIFDYDRYCFGMWKIIKSNGMIINELSEQKKTIIFFFGMIKNSLKFNNKNSYINDIGWQLIGKMQTNEWFKENIEPISDIEEIDYKILHKYNIYEDDI